MKLGDTEQFCNLNGSSKVSTGDYTYAASDSSTDKTWIRNESTFARFLQERTQICLWPVQIFLFIV